MCGAARGELRARGRFLQLLLRRRLGAVQRFLGCLVACVHLLLHQLRLRVHEVAEETWVEEVSGLTLGLGGLLRCGCEWNGLGGSLRPPR